jgi:hypothetical protein
VCDACFAKWLGRHTLQKDEEVERPAKRAKIEREMKTERASPGSKIAGKGGSNAIFVGQAFETEDSWVNTVTTSHFLANLAL